MLCINSFGKLGFGVRTGFIQPVYWVTGMLRTDISTVVPIADIHHRVLANGSSFTLRKMMIILRIKIGQP